LPPNPYLATGNDQRANQETTGINHVEVIQTVIASLEQDERDGQPNRGKLCLEV